MPACCPGPPIFPGEGGFSVSFVNLLPAPRYWEPGHGAELRKGCLSESQTEVWVLSLERGNATVLVAGCAHSEPKMGIKSQSVGEQLAAAGPSLHWLLCWTDISVRARDGGALTCSIREAALSFQSSSFMNSCFL